MALFQPPLRYGAPGDAAGDLAGARGPLAAACPHHCSAAARGPVPGGCVRPKRHAS